MDTRRPIIALVLVVMLIVMACSHGSQGRMQPLGTPPPSAWPATWIGLSTDPDEKGGKDHRDVTDTDGDGYAVYYAADSQYLYMRMETVTAPGWNSTRPDDEARYKWWFDTANTAVYVHGTTVENGEFLLILEDLTDNSNDPALTRDLLGELTLMDDLENDGFMKRWNSAHPPNYTINNAQTTLTGNSSWWRRTLGSGTAGNGGPQGVMDVDIGYRIDSTTSGGNFVDMYVSWAALGNPSSLCLIWATDNIDPNLDQAQDLDRPEQTTCLLVCVPPVAAFNATPASGCAPLTVTFADQSAGNITSWNWTFGDGGTSALHNPSHQYTSPGSYNITLNVTTACGSDTETKTDYITVHARPTVDAGVDKSFCAGSSVQIGGSPTGSGGTGPYTYSWTPMTGLDDPAIANPSASAVGTYIVTVTDANGCWNEDSVLVMQNPAPAAEAGSNKSISSCGGSVRIGGSPTGSSGTGPYTYSWTPTTGLSNPSVPNPTASAGGTYTVRVTDVNGCWAEDSVVVTVSNAPTADAGPDQEICPDGSLQIGGSPTGSGGTGFYTYSWTPTAGLDNPAVANPYASPTSTTTYSVLVSDGDDCQAVDSVIVTVHDILACHVSASPSTSVCQGTTVTLTEDGGDAVSWSWSTGAHTQSAQVTSGGTYGVTIADTHGCQSSCQISVTVQDAPIADAGVDKEILVGGSVDIGGSPTGSGGTGALTYSWSPTTGLSNASTANPIASPSVNTTYTVIVADSKGCTDSDDVTVTVDQGWWICGFVHRAGTKEALTGWEVVLEMKTSPWHEVRRTVTNADGKYYFSGLGTGEYRVSEVVKLGWTRLSPVPNEYLVSLPEGASDPEYGPFLNFENDQYADPPPTVGWEASPVDKLAVLAPWIALFTVILAGVSLLLLGRRGRRAEYTRR
jgi:PKD repeat protein